MAETVRYTQTSKYRCMQTAVALGNDAMHCEIINEPPNFEESLIFTYEAAAGSVPRQ